jgi:hypothetical protein
MEDGSKAPASDFLARNGLRYGQIYGYAIDMTSTGPTKGAWRDAAHKNATNGLTVPGQWVAQPWRWNGTVTDFQHDGSWDFQLPVPGLADYKWWNSAGYDAAGEKCEHLSPVSNSAWLVCRLSGWNALSNSIFIFFFSTRQCAHFSNCTTRTFGRASRPLSKGLRPATLAIATLMMSRKFLTA